MSFERQNFESIKCDSEKLFLPSIHFVGDSFQFLVFSFQFEFEFEFELHFYCQSFGVMLKGCCALNNSSQKVFTFELYPRINFLLEELVLLIQVSVTISKHRKY